MVAIFLGRLLEGEPCRIFGDGSQARDYIYVGDVARATIAALDSDAGGVLNIGTGVATTVLELYDVCRSVVGLGCRAGARGRAAGRARAERPRR